MYVNNLAVTYVVYEFVYQSWWDRSTNDTS